MGVPGPMGTATVSVSTVFRPVFLSRHSRPLPPFSTQLLSFNCGEIQAQSCWLFAQEQSKLEMDVLGHTQGPEEEETLDRVTVQHTSCSSLQENNGKQSKSSCLMYGQRKYDRNDSTWLLALRVQIYPTDSGIKGFYVCLLFRIFI